MSPIDPPHIDLPPIDRILRPWRYDDPALARLVNETGLEISVLPNAGVFAIRRAATGGAILINRTPGSPVEGGLGRLWLRAGGRQPAIIQALGPRAAGRFGQAQDRFVWEGEEGGLRRRLTLWLHPRRNLWLWLVDVTNANASDTPCDAVFVQDLGLGAPGFLLGGEAYASHYVDHHVAPHPRFGPVVMSRRTMAQEGRHPWIAHGCLEGAASFATDAMQLFGPAYRDAAEIGLGFGSNLPGERLQHEAACAAIQSRSVILPPGGQARWTFFALYEPDHPEATSEADLARLDAAADAARAFAAGAGASPTPALRTPARSLLQDAPPLATRPLDAEALARLYPERVLEERCDGALLSFFLPEHGARSRHVVLAEKERRVRRRHGAILRSGQAMLPDDQTLCATCWMHGVFAAQLTLGNTSLHKLFTVSRDPCNIGRSGGLRILADLGEGWRLLTVPSAFEMGLNDCRWIYATRDRIITVSAAVSGAEPAMAWRASVEGEPCRFLVFGQIALGEHEYAQAGRLAIDPAGKRLSFRPDPESLWGKTCPDAVFHLVTGSPAVVEAVGGDELLDAEGLSRGAPWAALRSAPTTALNFAVVGSLTDPAAAGRLADAWAAGGDEGEGLRQAEAFWRHVGRDLRLTGGGGDASDAALEPLNALLPWLVHDAMIHLTVPHGLEQTTGAAWGVRDVCQGPVEFLLALEHDRTVKDILRIVFAQQYERRGTWPQWFMHEPYAQIQDPNSHGDVVLWPLKALCDYIEHTNDFAFLDESVPWRRESDFRKTDDGNPVTDHVEKLLAAVEASFLPGLHVMRYGEGDWNDTLQPADPALRERLASSWTAALLYQQLRRYGALLERRGAFGRAAELASLADDVRTDFNRVFIRDGIVAGYALFDGPDAEPELLLHPSDRRTGVSYALIPMTCAITGGLFTPEQAEYHWRLIREHLIFPDGARLMDRPPPYRGGVERLFRRAESSAFFGREIGLMYVHAHLRCCEAAAALGDAQALWEGLAVASPIAVTERLPHAALRQRNAYFTSSDAAFRHRYEASADWWRVRTGGVPVEGGWRIYSSGPGLFLHLLLSRAAGVGRRFGERICAPLPPPGQDDLTAEMTIEGERRRGGWPEGKSRRGKFPGEASGQAGA